MQTHALLGSTGPPLEQARTQAPGAISACDFEAELLSLRDAAAVMHAAADCVAADCRQLVAKLEDTNSLRAGILMNIVLVSSEADTAFVAV